MVLIQSQSVTGPRTNGHTNVSMITSVRFALRDVARKAKKIPKNTLNFATFAYPFPLFYVNQNLHTRFYLEQLS